MARDVLSSINSPGSARTQPRVLKPTAMRESPVCESLPRLRGHWKGWGRSDSKTSGAGGAAGGIERGCGATKCFLTLETSAASSASTRIVRVKRAAKGHGESCGPDQQPECADSHSHLGSCRADLSNAWRCPGLKRFWRPLWACLRGMDTRHLLGRRHLVCGLLLPLPPEAQRERATLREWFPLLRTSTHRTDAPNGDVNLVALPLPSSLRAPSASSEGR